MSTHKRKRTTFDVKQKLDIIDKYNGGMKPKEFASFYNVAASTISTIVTAKQ